MNTNKHKLIIPCSIILITTNGCFETEQTATPKVPALPAYTYAKPVAKPKPLTQSLLIEEPASKLGIDFVHNTGATGKKLMPETMGPGCALFDYDQDGYLDVAFTDGRAFADSTPRPMLRLYRNQGGSGAQFTDVTHTAGLTAISGYGMGLAIADYDADGDSDVLITTVTGSRLLQNNNAVFIDVTQAAGLELTTPEWATSAAWLDADRDGWLDVFIANYVQWSPETDVFTTLDGTNKSYATPTVYTGLDNRLFRNLGKGKFTDITATAGLISGDNKALGIVVLDANNDGMVDIFISNDTVANKLYLNDGAGNFIDNALAVGVGYDEQGQARAGMGVDSGAAVTGAQAIVIGNFSDEPISLYEKVQNGTVFIDAAQKRGVAIKTMSRLTFGTRFADLNHDGLDDLILVNGHIEPDIQKVQNAVAYKEPIDVFIAQTNGRLVSLEDLTGKPVSQPIVGRCLAMGDIDNDGDLDGLVAVNGGNPLILRNTTGRAQSLLMDIYDAKSPGNRQALGATVTLNGKNWSRREMVRARGSYLGHSPYTLHFGIPPTAGTDITVTVQWTDGTIETMGTAQVGNHYRIMRAGQLTTIKHS